MLPRIRTFFPTEHDHADPLSAACPWVAGFVRNEASEAQPGETVRT